MRRRVTAFSTADAAHARPAVDVDFRAVESLRTGTTPAPSESTATLPIR